MKKGDEFIMHGSVSVPMYKEPFCDDSLSMSARGVLATIMAKGWWLDAKFYKENKGAVRELQRKGYLLEWEDPDTGEYIYDVSAEPNPQGIELCTSEYSKILSDATGLKWNAKEYSVHHINHDRTDNRLSNLLLLPVKLHSKYHYYSYLTKTLRERLVFDDLITEVIPQKNKLLSFFYTVCEMAEMKSNQDDLISNIKEYAARGEYFPSKEFFLKRNEHILNKYIS